MKHSHYHKTVPTLNIDIYRVLHTFNVTDPCLQHSIKKLLCAGGRGAKDAKRDVEEAMDSLVRYLEMRREEQQVTMQGNNLSINVEDDLRFGEARADVIGQNGNDGDHYTPKFGPDAYGWIEWRGGECPVKANAYVYIRMRNGNQSYVESRWCNWLHYNESGDIVAYKIISQFSPERRDDAEVVS